MGLVPEMHRVGLVGLQACGERGLNGYTSTVLRRGQNRRQGERQVKRNVDRRSKRRRPFPRSGTWSGSEGVIGPGVTAGPLDRSPSPFWRKS